MATVRPSFAEAHARVRAHAYRTPLLTSRTLSGLTGFDVRLNAEVFQRTGSYKIRGPLNKLLELSEEERARGVICSSAGNHAQGVALAAGIYGIPAVVVMAGETKLVPAAKTVSPRERDHGASTRERRSDSLTANRLA